MRVRGVSRTRRSLAHRFELSSFLRPGLSSTDRCRAELLDEDGDPAGDAARLTAVLTALGIGHVVVRSGFFEWHVYTIIATNGMAKYPSALPLIRSTLLVCRMQPGYICTPVAIFNDHKPFPSPVARY